MQIAGDGGGLCSTRTGVLNRANDEWGTTAGRDPDDNVLTCRASTGDVALTDLRRVFVDVGRAGEGRGAASHYVLDLRGSRGVRWWALRGVEGGDTAAGTCTDIDESATITEGTCHCIDDDGDLWQRFLNCCRDLRVLVVDDSGYLK